MKLDINNKEQFQDFVNDVIAYLYQNKDNPKFQIKKVNEFVRSIKYKNFIITCHQIEQGWYSKYCVSLDKVSGKTTQNLFWFKNEGEVPMGRELSMFVFDLYEKFVYVRKLDSLNKCIEEYFKTTLDK